jgi:DNA-binding NarL/FixJ family response regulator
MNMGPKATEDDAYFSAEEIQVLTLLRQGATRAEIARRLGIDWSAVPTCVAPILRRLGARSPAELRSLVDELLAR